MSSSIAGSIYYSGLSGSGTDWTQTLEQLKQIESIQLNRLQAWQDDWNLRYQAFGKIIEAAQSTKSQIATLKNRNNFVSKLVTSSDDGVVTGTANSNAQNMQHTINVKQVASNSVWANKHVFSSKNDIINKTDNAVDFKFTYGGKTVSISVPPNTTLDSFVSLVNNSKDNPGITVSTVKTSGGYLFQVAGKDTGEENNLVIYDCALEGMSAAGTSSSWSTSKEVNLGEVLTDPSDFVFDLVYDNGTKKSITIKGNSSLNDLVDAINSQTGRKIASLDPSGNLKLDGVQSFKRRESSEDADVPPSVKVYAGTKEDMSKPLVDGGTGQDLTFNVVVDKGYGYKSTISVTVKDTATREEFLATLAQATGNTANMSMSDDGRWYMGLSGVESITPAGGGSMPTGISVEQTPASGTSVDYTGGATKAFSTTLTFSKDKLSEKLSDANPPKELTYTFTMGDGTTKTVKISSDKTNEELLNAIQAEMGGSIVDEANGDKTLKLDDVRGMALTQGYVDHQGYSATVKAEMTIANGTIAPESAGAGGGENLLETPPDLEYTVVKNDGTEVKFSLASGSTMQNVLDELKAQGLDASVVGGKLVVKDIVSLTGPGITGQITDSDNWNIKQSANAIYTVDNWPMELESSSNSISDVIEGVTINLQGVGEATINVNTDVDALQESVQAFLDAVNSLLVTVQTFTKYDENAETTSTDPEDDNYSMSQLTSQKGGLLQGNYGVQLFNSRFKAALTGTPAGYQGRTSADDILSGDLLANLANMGIKTDTDQNSETYGLLVIAPASTIDSLTELDQENYNKMMSENMEAVVDFFCGPSTPGTSTTNAFRYASSVQGITQAGIYDVSYEVDSAGNILEVYINGVKANNDPSMGSNYYSCPSGDARGLSILIDDLAPGKHEGQVRIKYGLLDTVDNFLKEELTWQDTGKTVDDDSLAVKSKNGALMILQDNYKTIMENIQEKIDREKDRIALWEERQKAAFARLETLLAKYNKTQTSLESQLKQLSGGS
ncbi:flagellar filament capping protein FliD [uncultured Desulfovibrio sp.]|uniref:flagellar filament capping protein FliD n=1 Tax=uncultured Desulfovibrio sp. TaxID=167968 RepID=UPI00262AF8B6|nr:flagellar filament capping protein FliD [uncultured Desulfovibrio sp.]